MTRSLWPPAIVLVAGALLATVGVRSQRSLSLRGPLATAVPTTLEGFGSRDVSLTPEEIEAVGVTSYLSRLFERPEAGPSGARFFLLYVGYYDRQTSGRTIHSPKNCLPGSGWEPLTNQLTSIATPTGPVIVNRYLIQKGREQALVLYWYQGRGRVAANEYAVKWNLVRDAALRRRSDEALVRVVVPIVGSEAAALELASRVARQVVSGLGAALPAA
jgi:EpsI family protein